MIIKVRPVIKIEEKGWGRLLTENAKVTKNGTKMELGEFLGKMLEGGLKSGIKIKF